MHVIRELLGSGRIVELILGLMLVEAVLLILWYRSTGRGIAPVDLCINLAAGALLLLALRAAAAGGDMLAAAPFLSAALVAHVLDLARRWNR